MGESDLSLLNSLVTATGWMLVHFLWQGFVIGALYWLLCAFSRPDNAHLRYWAGLSSYLLALATLLITFAVYYEPAARFSSEPLAAYAVNSFIVMSGSRPDLWTSLQYGIEPALPVIVLIWLAGVLALTAKTTYGWYGTRKLLRSGVTPISVELQKSVDDLADRLAVRRTVTVLKSALVRVPMVIGWFKPVILMPAGVLAGMPRDQLEMVIAHELGHIRRCDYLVNLLQIVIETLLFYHPAIRWVSRRVREEREHCCDDLVVTHCGKPVVYAKSLANLEVIRGPVTATAMAATGGELLARVRRIVDTELPRNGAGYAQVSMMAVVALVVAFSAQQGMSLTRTLTEIAESARLQVSDIEIETWSRSRAAWTAGVDRFSREAGFQVAGEEAREEAVIEQERLPVSTPPAEFHRTVRKPANAVVAMVDPQIVLDELPDAPVAAPVPERNTDAAETPGRTLTGERPAAAAGPPKIKPLKVVQPKYPWRARNKGLEGFVKMEFSVDGEGRVREIEILDSFPENVFDRAATKALRKWKFDTSDALADGRRLRQTFDFDLGDEVQYVTNYRECRTTGSRTCGLGARSAIVVYVNPPTARKSSPAQLK